MNTNVIERAKQTAKNANIYLLDMNEVVGTPERPTYEKVTPPDGPPIYSVRDTRSMMTTMMGIAHENERGFVEANRLRMAQRNLDGAIRNLDAQTRRDVEHFAYGECVAYSVCFGFRGDSFSPTGQYGHGGY